MICRFARVNWLRHGFLLRFHELNCFSHARQRNSCGAVAIHDACINSCVTRRNSCQKDVSKPYRRFRSLAGCAKPSASAPVMYPHRTGMTAPFGSVLRHKKRGRSIRPSSLNLIPALTCSPANTLRSTIGDGALNCRVRHGTGCGRPSLGTGNSVYDKHFRVYFAYSSFPYLHN